MRLRDHHRRAATAVEFALVAPLAIVLVLGLLIGGLGVFRYQHVAHLAREATRWASVHGTQYAQFTNKPAAKATDVYNQVIVPNAAGLDLGSLSYSVTWNTSNDPYHTATVNGNQVMVANTVKVTITYVWVPEALFGGSTLTSTAVSAMSY